MKTNLRNYGTMALFVAFSFIALNASANGGKDDSTVASLKYMGNVKNQPIFQLDLNSVTEEYFRISVKDQFGETLYTENVKAKLYTKTFRLDTDNLDAATLKIEVRNGNKKPEVFTINRKSSFVEETSISKL